MPRCSALLSSHSTLRAARPLRAAQKPLARTATPAGTSTTSATPGTLSAAALSTDFTVAPKTGGRAITAVSMSGMLTSIVKRAEPSVLAIESTRGATLPISVQSLGSLSGTSAGTGSWAAARASSPNVAFRPVAACDTTPL